MKIVRVKTTAKMADDYRISEWTCPYCGKMEKVGQVEKEYMRPVSCTKCKVGYKIITR